MTDIVSKKKRSQMMAGIKSKNTKPELLIRSELHKRNFRFRIHVQNLPGKPDIVLSKFNAVIFIHGCFWHGHNCSLFKLPSTRTKFWKEKIWRNRENDQIASVQLKKQKWRVLIIWECALKGKQRLPVDGIVESISSWLYSSENFKEIKGVS